MSTHGATPLSRERTRSGGSPRPYDVTVASHPTDSSWAAGGKDDRPENLLYAVIQIKLVISVSGPSVRKP